MVKLARPDPAGQPTRPPGTPTGHWEAEPGRSGFDER
jgi:hypothetical protein